MKGGSEQASERAGEGVREGAGSNGLKGKSLQYSRKVKERRRVQGSRTFPQRRRLGRRRLAHAHARAQDRSFKSVLALRHVQRAHIGTWKLRRGRIRQASSGGRAFETNEGWLAGRRRRHRIRVDQAACPAARHPCLLFDLNRANTQLQGGQ